MIEETYAVFSVWNFDRSKRENFDRLREENFIGAGSMTWLRDVAKVLNRRFDPAGRDRSLVELAKHGLSMEEWKPLLLWHMTRDEFLVRDFLETWLFSAFDAGAFRIRAEDVEIYLTDVEERGGITEHTWSEQTIKRVASGLLKIAVDFGLLRGSLAKEFTSYHLPERSFLYLLHAMRDERLNPDRLVTSRNWRLFLMRPADVEHEILRLHQFKKLDYQVAGSLAQLSLPCSNTLEFAERMVA
jgi:DNA-binding phage protein